MLGVVKQLMIDWFNVKNRNKSGTKATIHAKTTLIQAPDVVGRTTLSLNELTPVHFTGHGISSWLFYFGPMCLVLL